MVNVGDKPPFAEGYNAADLRNLITYHNRFEYATDKETLGNEKVQSPEYFKTPRPRRSLDDMVQQELNGKVKTVKKPKLSRENNVTHKETFDCVERVKGKMVNILEGLELHHGIFSSRDQEEIVKLVYDLQKMGEDGKLKGRTFSAPSKWMRGKGRVTIQFGCCYNYATDSNGNPPGILQNELVDPIPHLFKSMIHKLLKQRVLPPTCVPDSCIVNIYEIGDCIPPHVDSHDFVRPFCTISFLSECNILFGSNLIPMGPGEFSGSYEIPLPVGSVLVLDGNGADVAKHCVPAVPTKRISITFRKMDESKWPAGFVPEPDLLGLEQLVYESDTPKSGSSISRPPSHHPSNRQTFRRERFVQGLEPLAYESGTHQSGSSISKPPSHPSNRRTFRREAFVPEHDFQVPEPLEYESGTRKSGSRISKLRLHPYRRDDVDAVRRLLASHLPCRSKSNQTARS